MSNPDGTNLHASTFDLDAWIDGDARPEVTVSLYAHEFEFMQRLDEIERAMRVAEATKPEDRGLGDPSPETLLAQATQLREKREAGALKVRLRQLTQEEIAVALRRGMEAGAVNAAEAALWAVSEATIDPHFTPEQLLKLRKRDLAGEQQVGQLTAAADNLTRLPVPFSPES